ncbi:MAG: hypothetical protein DRO88_03745 [Promethearchaeia archaeon]|nr:MAG: hypothetical protein DRO88_03745 [Candidatus Lokiarchaeia archaeon]
MQKYYGIICDVGGKNKGNQDSVFYLQFDVKCAPAYIKDKYFSHQGILALVCDGVSASHHGDEGSSFVIKHLPMKILNYLFTQNVILSEIQQIIKRAIQETNQELIQKYSDEIQKGNIPKTTLVGLLLLGPWVWIFNLGDSRAYLVKDDEIRQVSLDHVGTGAAHEIVEAIGQDEVQPEIKVFNWAYLPDVQNHYHIFHSKYYAVLCSDGLTDKVNEQEINKILQQRTNKETLQDIVMKLYSLSMDRNIDDNISIIIIDFKKFFDNLSNIEKIRLEYP